MVDFKQRKPVIPTIRMGQAILRWHMFIAGTVTWCLAAIALAIMALVLLYQGSSLTYAAFHDPIYKYRYFILYVILVSYLGPVSFYTITKTLTHRYRRFHIVVYADEDLADRADEHGVRLVPKPWSARVYSGMRVIYTRVKAFWAT